MTVDEAHLEAILSDRGFVTDEVGTFQNSDTVFLAETVDAEQRVIKFLGESDLAEPAILRTVREATDLPVPAVFDAEVPGPGDTPGLVVMDYLDGRPIESARDLDLEPFEAALYEVGRTLARLHDAVQFDSHGQFAVADGTLTAERTCTWESKLFDSIAADLADALAESRFEGRADPFRAFVHEARGITPADSDPALLHSAVRWDHVLFADDCWTPTGLLSWGVASVGHRELDLVQAAYWLVDQHVANPKKRERLHDSLYDGYDSGSSDWHPDDGFDRRRELYRAVAIAKTMVHFDDWAESINPVWRHVVARRYRKDLDALVE